MRFVKHQSKQQLQTCSGCAEGLESVSKGISFAIIKLFVKFFDEIMVFDAGRALIASFLKVDDKVKDGTRWIEVTTIWKRRFQL